MHPSESFCRARPTEAQDGTRRLRGVAETLRLSAGGVRWPAFAGFHGFSKITRPFRPAALVNPMLTSASIALMPLKLFSLNRPER
jgi:hypothetical protein